MLSGPGRVKAPAPHEILVSRDLCTSSKTTFVSFTEEDSMTKLHRSTTICWLFLGVLLLAGTSRAQTRPPIVEQLAKTYGLDSWGQIDAVRYTFNIQIPALKLALAHSWQWQPKTGEVTYESKAKDGKPVKVTYNRSQLNNAPANVKDEVDPAFM